MRHCTVLRVHAPFPRKCRFQVLLRRTRRRWTESAPVRRARCSWCVRCVYWSARADRHARALDEGMCVMRSDREQCSITRTGRTNAARVVRHFGVLCGHGGVLLVGGDGIHTKTAASRAHERVRGVARVALLLARAAVCASPATGTAGFHFGEVSDRSLESPKHPLQCTVENPPCTANEPPNTAVVIGTLA